MTLLIVHVHVHVYILSMLVLVIEFIGHLLFYSKLVEKPINCFECLLALT